MRKIRLENKQGQVWVETVIYTLIGLTIIGILLAVSTPKIGEMRDRLRINEAVDVIGQIDSAIIEVRSAPGNIRIIDLEVSKGKFVVNGTNDSVYWIMDSSYAYSEPGVEVPLGDLSVTTTQTGGNYEVKILREYAYNIQATEGEVLELEVAAVLYSLKIQSSGTYGQDLAINFSV